MPHAARAAAAILALAASACGGRGIAVVQAHHGHEFRCDRRYVRVEREEDDRWISRGCGFEAEWACRDGECTLIDARSHGMGAP